jgi:hypothetical protein
MHVKGVEITSVPGPTPDNLKAIVSAIVHELTGTTLGLPMNWAIRSANASTFVPSARNPLANVSAIISVASGGMKTLNRGILPLFSSDRALRDFIINKYLKR